MHTFLTNFLPDCLSQIEKKHQQYQNLTPKLILAGLGFSISLFIFSFLSQSPKLLSFSLISIFLIPLFSVLSTTYFYHDRAAFQSIKLIEKFRLLINDESYQETLLRYLHNIKNNIVQDNYFNNNLNNHLIKINNLLKKTEYFLIEPKHIDLVYLKEINEIIQEHGLESEKNYENELEINNIKKIL